MKNKIYTYFKFGLYVLFCVMHFTIMHAQEEKMKRSSSKTLSIDSRSGANEIQQDIDSAGLNLSLDPQKAFDFAEKALIQSIRNKDKLNEGKSYQLLGRLNSQIKQYDLAIDYFLKAIDAFQSRKQYRLINESYIQLAESHYYLSNYTEAENYYNKALLYFEDTGDMPRVISIKNHLADIYVKKQDTKKAKEVYNEILTEEKKRDNTRGVIDVQNKMGGIYETETEKQEQAIQTYKQSADMAREIDDADALTQSLENQGRVLRKSKRYDEELQVRKELNDISVGAGDVTQQVDNILEISDIYIEQNKEDDAIQFIEEGIELSEKTGDLEKKGKALQKLSSVYGRKRDYGKALEVYKNYVKTIDAIHANQKKEILASLELYSKLNRKLERLDMLERDFELNKKTILLLQQEQSLKSKELKVQKILTWTLIIALMSIIIASTLIYRSAINKRKANQLLALKSLQGQMNPHFIYNSLNSINNYIAKNDERSANKYLSSFSRLMRSVMDHSKQEFVQLSSEIEILKLYLDLEHSRFPDKFDYTFSVANDIPTEGIIVPPMLIQPYIENSIWHGLRYKDKKGRLDVSVAMEKGLLLIKIIDDGIGRKKSKELKTKHQKGRQSTGLKNIENRLKILREVFQYSIEVCISDLNDTDKTGTIVTLRIPFKVTGKI